MLDYKDILFKTKEGKSPTFIISKFSWIKNNLGGKNSDESDCRNDISLKTTSTTQVLWKLNFHFPFFNIFVVNSKWNFWRSVKVSNFKYFHELGLWCAGLLESIQSTKIKIKPFWRKQTVSNEVRTWQTEKSVAVSGSRPYPPAHTRAVGLPSGMSRVVARNGHSQKACLSGSHSPWFVHPGI